MEVNRMNTNFELTSIESEQDYEAVTARYEEVKRWPKGSDQHKEKLLLVNLISEYEKAQWDLSEVDSAEFDKIWKEDYGSYT